MTPRMEKLLVGVDQSDASLWAVARAAWLPRSEEAVVTLLHVIHRDLQLAPLLESFAEDDAPVLLKAGEQRAREAAASAGQGVHVTTAICHGIPFVEIIRRAREDRTELVLVGRQGTRSFGDGLIGSTAERVVRKAGSPVLVVTCPPAARYRRALLAVDLSPTSRRAVALALRVVDPGVRTIDVVHARNKGQDEDLVRQEVLAFLSSVESAGITWNVIVRDGDPRRVILSEAAERHSDLLALGTHGRTGVAQILIGSVAEAVVRAAPCDVLVARPEKRAFAMP